MLDRDLAEMYGVETRVFKQSVRRNIDRFPDDFMFILSEKESKQLIEKGVSQNVIPAGYNLGGSGMFVFTEQGVAMLSTVLKSKKAIDVNINIMRAFVALRQYALGYAELNRKLEDFMIATNMQLNEVYQALQELAERKAQEETPRKIITGFRLPEKK
jgi:hypothetical protein